MNLFKRLSTRLILKLVFLGTCVAMLISSTAGMFNGQAQTNPGWSEPINLSNSSFTDNPNMVVDSDGVYHVIWKDEFAGVVYANGDGVEWSLPDVVALPSAETIPQLFADLNGYIHAFWRDDDSMLFHSRVRAGDFDTYSAWTAPVLIDNSALSFDVALDDNGDIHLIYVRPENELGFPAGVYYRRLRIESNDWFAPSVLYLSHYMRSSELEGSNVDISTGIIDDQVSVYAAWDNRLRGRVFLAKSLDGGQTWDQPKEVDKPNEGTGTNSTSNIKVSAVDQHVLIMWQRMDAGLNCSQFYQWSNDNGTTWSNPQKMLEDANGCGTDIQLLRSKNGQIILWIILQNQVNLLAWDQNRWSKAQIQYELSVFEDPDTLNLVAFGCHNPQMLDEELAVVGCDTGEGADIWLTEREISDFSDWYASPSDWITPEELVSSQNRIDSPVIVADANEYIHVLWSQAANVAGNGDATSIFYMGGDGERWSQPITVFQSPNGNAIQPSAALDKDERLLVVWSDSQSGDILFSWANAARAGRPAEWVDPIPLPISQTTAVSPSILVDDSGTIIVVFAVPINEGRGIYLTSSTDLGESWSSPIQIFNGVGAGWQIVDQPQLTQTPDGDLHALWVQRALPQIGGTLGLYYAHSEDAGISWSEAERVVDGEVTWSQITSDAQGSVYRVWQDVLNNQYIIRYQRLLGDNPEWSVPESLSSFGESLRIAKLVVDQVGQLHLLQIVQDLSGRLILRHWIWEDEHWVVSENSELAYAPTSDVISMAAAISSDAEMNLIFSTVTESELSEVFQNNLFFTHRKLELLPSEMTPAEPTSNTLLVNTPTPSTTPTAQSLITPTVEPTYTPDLNPLGSIEPVSSGDSSFSGLVVGGVLAGLIVFSAIGFGIWRTRISH